MNRSIDCLKENNPSLKIEEGYDEYTLLNLWADESLSFVFDKSSDLSFLEEITLPEHLVAIHHKSLHQVEFIFSLLVKESPLINRKFVFNYKGKSYECYFDKSSMILKNLSVAFRETDFDTKSDYRNLREFRDFYTIEDQPEFIKEFFKNREPYSFFVKCDGVAINIEFTAMLKTLNYYMSYYDRNSPTVVLITPEKAKDVYAQPCYSDEEKFPEMVNAQVIDSTLLETILVANKTEDLRLKFIFYYQMLEYCSYYHLDSEIKKQLFHILKKPEVSYKANEYSKLIIDELQDYFNKNKYDSNKLEKTISYFCSIEDVKFELRKHQDYFCKDVEFEGGLKINKLFKDPAGIDSMIDTILNQIRINIEKIRNVLVHLRESRENKVILPTEYNDQLLTPYLFVLRRIAEKVAMQFE